MEQFLVTAATNSIPVRAAEFTQRHTAPRQEQQCKDHAPSLMRQMSLCAADALHHPQHIRQSWVTNNILRQQHLQHPHPLNHLHQHRQQCFWTDTSVLAQAGAPEDNAVCSGISSVY
jgi:hypothetical protein